MKSNKRNKASYEWPKTNNSTFTRNDRIFCLAFSFNHLWQSIIHCYINWETIYKETVWFFRFYFWPF